jgi:hypothetical protein
VLSNPWLNPGGGMLVVFITELPVMEWWIEEPELARWDEGGRGAVLYLDRFYDNVKVSLKSLLNCRDPIEIPVELYRLEA